MEQTETPQEQTIDAKIEEIKLHFVTIARQLGIVSRDFENKKQNFIVQMNELDQKFAELMQQKEAKDGSSN